MSEKRQKNKVVNAVRAVLAALVVFVATATGDSFAQTPSPGPVKNKSQQSAVQNKSGVKEPAEARSGTRLMLSGKYLHLSCNRSLRDLTNNKLECFGNVYIRRPSELMTADYAIMDMNTEQLHAEGNVVYFTPNTVIYGSAMDFNFVTETGTIKNGRVESDKYQLLGEKIDRLAIDHFVATDGEYTTCRDCPASWKLAGKTIDLTIDGYAHLSNVYIKINEAPSLYLPYAIIPVKTKRQSGLLFPKIQPASAQGFVFVQPYYWAISRSQDLTLGGGFYTQHGPKGELEYRYVLDSKSSGELRAFYLRDKQFIEPFQDRWAAQYNHKLVLPGKVEQRISLIDASDRDYPRRFEDIPGKNEPALVSTAGLSRSDRDVTSWVSATRIKNLMTSDLVGFDGNTVQVLPSASLTTLDHTVGKTGLHWAFNVNYSRFTRTGPDFDPIDTTGSTTALVDSFLPGRTPLRKAHRFNLVPELYYPARVAEVIEVVPSVQYRTFYYLFDEVQTPPTARGYLLAQNEVATTVDRVYGARVKHKVRPSLVYSNIPVIQQKESHAFIQQIRKSGNQFDDFDIVPITNETPLYFVPLGNSLTYRLSNKFILKTEEELTAYRKAVDLTAGQSINFIELRESASTREPLSPFFALLTVDTLRVTGSGEFFYYPYIKRSRFNLSANYIFAKYTRRLLTFERSIGLSYSSNQVTATSKSISGGFTFSINDYVGVLGNITYLFPEEKFNQVTPGFIRQTSAGVVYQSPSQCYKINLIGSWSLENPKVAVSLDIPINLTGEGFTNLQEGGGLASTGR